MDTWGRTHWGGRERVTGGVRRRWQSRGLAVSGRVKSLAGLLGFPLMIEAGTEERNG